MARYIIGDVHGCYKPLKALLKKIEFDIKKDELWFVGDILNRGPDSLKTLQFIMRLGSAAKMVLGNHELHLLAAYAGLKKFQNKTDTLLPIIEHKKVDKMIDWLRHQPLIIRDKKQKIAMVHAGIPPQWTIKKAMKKSRKVEKILQSKNWKKRIVNDFFGNQPDYWSSKLSAKEKIRYTVNALARMRYCDKKGTLDFDLKMHPDQTPKKANLKPWFMWEERKATNYQIYFGHWSTLGVIDAYNIHTTDLGCLWGGNLTAYCIDTQQRITYNCTK